VIDQFRRRSDFSKYSIANRDQRRGRTVRGANRRREHEFGADHGGQSGGYRSTRKLRAREGDCDFRWHGRDSADSRIGLRWLALRSASAVIFQARLPERGLVLVTSRNEYVA
jgi:hypothetical protein